MQPYRGGTLNGSAKRYSLALIELVLHLKQVRRQGTPNETHLNHITTHNYDHRLFIGGCYTRNKRLLMPKCHEQRS